MIDNEEETASGTATDAGQEVSQETGEQTDEQSQEQKQEELTPEQELERDLKQLNGQLGDESEETTELPDDLKGADDALEIDMSVATEKDVIKLPDGTKMSAKEAMKILSANKSREGNGRKDRPASGVDPALRSLYDVNFKTIVSQLKSMYPLVRDVDEVKFYMRGVPNANFDHIEPIMKYINNLKKKDWEDNNEKYVQTKKAGSSQFKIEKSAGNPKTPPSKPGQKEKVFDIHDREAHERVWREMLEKKEEGTQGV